MWGVFPEFNVERLFRTSNRLDSLGDEFDVPPPPLGRPSTRRATVPRHEGAGEPPYKLPPCAAAPATDR